jgi:ribosomal RNA-processing protein 17
MGPPTKKRKITVTVPEKIEFDFSAREEYLTGFHKRKVARQKFAQDEAAKKEKEEKLRFRKEVSHSNPPTHPSQFRFRKLTHTQQLRQQRKVDLEKHVEEVNRLVKQANGDIAGLTDNDSDSDDDEEEFTGFQEPEPINQEDEYIDEDKYTTVTIESVNISRDGFSKPGEDEVDHADAAKKTDEAKKDEEGEVVGKDGKREIQRDENGKRIWTKERPRTEWPKKKKKKFRYENKADRKVTRYKEGAKKRKQKAAREKE